MIYSILAPEWLQQENGDARPLEGEFSQKEIEAFNSQGFNIYYYPNHPKYYHNDGFLRGKDIDIFEWVFVDCDLKDGYYKSKDEFIAELCKYLAPTKIVDSGGGIHAYWRISDLDSTSFITFNRRLARLFNTDLAVGKIKQLMRVPNTFNTKIKDNPRLCQLLYTSEDNYTCEDLDKMLPKLSSGDDEYCKRHYDQTYNTNTSKMQVDESLPPKFGELLRNNLEVREIWSGNTNDRSKSDFRLGCIMLASGFTKSEAMSVLVNCGKALSRSLAHRVSYAENIITRIWTYEEAKDKTIVPLSSTVKEILQRSGTALKGTRLRCWPYLDNTVHGFRVGHVIGLVAGSGVGKTAVALNMFLGFVESNPDLDHIFIPLEQPANEIADRWKTLCGDKVHLHERVHVISNYDETGGFRHLSMDDLQEYIVKFQAESGKKIGCVVIDHIGVLKSINKNGENEGLMGICKAMKSFATKTNTLVVMQSQAPREKAGIGDLELNKDAAYGTVYFESYCDYLITMWQPLKRCYPQGAPTVTSFKFCKIRHKKHGQDVLKEDVPYTVMFDPNTEHLRELTEDEEKSFQFFLTQSTNRRKEDSKTSIAAYEVAKWS